MPAARVIVNGLALHRAHDAARVFLENLIQRLPDVWPAADVTVVLRDRSALPEGAANIKVETVPAARGGASRVVSELVGLPRLIRRLDADVVINPNESIPSRVDAALVVVSQNLLFHCPNVGPLDVGPWRARLRSRLQFAFYRRQMPRAYRRADAVVPVSRHAADQLSRRAGLDPARAHVVHYGSDRLAVKPRVVEGGARRLLIVGAVAHYKRLPEAVEALAILRRRGGDYRLDLAGGAWPGCERIVDEAARRAGIAGNVRLLGNLSGDQVADAYASAHAGLALSSCESFGIPVIEGMRAGLPHVVADEPWSAESVGDAAIRVDGTSPAAIADGIAQLENRGEWKRRSHLAEGAARGFTWEANAIGIARVAAQTVLDRSEKELRTDSPSDRVPDLEVGD